MKQIVLLLCALFSFNLSYSQNIDKIINAQEVERIETFLSSDRMQGQKLLHHTLIRQQTLSRRSLKNVG